MTYNRHCEAQGPDGHWAGQPVTTESTRQFPDVTPTNPL